MSKDRAAICLASLTHQCHEHNKNNLAVSSPPRGWSGNYHYLPSLPADDTRSFECTTSAFNGQRTFPTPAVPVEELQAGPDLQERRELAASQLRQRPLHMWHQQGRMDRYEKMRPPQHVPHLLPERLTRFRGALCAERCSQRWQGWLEADTNGLQARADKLYVAPLPIGSTGVEKCVLRERERDSQASRHQTRQPQEQSTPHIGHPWEEERPREVTEPEKVEDAWELDPDHENKAVALQKEAHARLTDPTLIREREEHEQRMRNQLLGKITATTTPVKMRRMSQIVPAGVVTRDHILTLINRTPVRLAPERPAPRATSRGLEPPALFGMHHTSPFACAKVWPTTHPRAQRNYETTTRARTSHMAMFPVT